ncbi:MFS transporter [Streptomyces sp. NBC_00059]|uniref:MFS transporter n=1 Tax=Streptomyces sp. NBC_00059 TaxID=2975635 RepID=UPI00338E57F4
MGVSWRAGIGAAGMFANGGAILATTFDGAARTRAFAALGSVAGLGLAAGPTLSGWLGSGLGWHATFGLHAVLLAVDLAGAGYVAESRAERRPPGRDRCCRVRRRPPHAGPGRGARAGVGLGEPGCAGAARRRCGAPCALRRPPGS